MTDCKTVFTPMSPSTRLTKFVGTPMDDPTLYWSTIGALQYATLTRLDIQFAINKVCHFMHSLTTDHWLVVKRILRYLKGTMSHGLLFHRHTTLSLSAFSNLDWANYPDDHKSTGGFAISLGWNLISWSSQKQATVARSSTKTEYRAIANVVAELTLDPILAQRA
ncbi:uncharacterized mitochondrial protein AtMg00810-like [Telopea speciosissima]|uniref:uncharacterized mitochondrial protein AtMg00810-like n=1 Tax=Telopea speciosissima TaxID=54955 RepID=UPI001CC66258|nr:uncharacterized mitochondrial protein AtMg00810-like [Telopea speciosissima]